MTSGGGWKDNVPRWFPGFLAVALVAALILNPASGFKSVVVWGGFLWLVATAFRQKRRLHAGGMGIPVVLYLAACLVSAWFSIREPWSFRQWQKLLELAAGFVVLVNVLSTPRRIQGAVHVFALAMGALACVDAARLLAGLVAGGSVLKEGRWYDSLLGYPTISAGMYGLAILLQLAMAMVADNRKTVVGHGLAMTATGVVLYFLQTRSALLGIACGSLIFLVLSPLAARHRAGVVAIVVFLLALVVLLPGKFGERILSRASSDRTALWKDAGRILQQGIEKEPFRAWTGFGYGHRIFEKLHRPMFWEEGQASRYYDHAHNMYLEARIQTGYLGVAAWGGLLLAAAWRVARRFPPREDKEQRLVAAGLCGAAASLLIYGQFSLFFAYLPALVFWSLLALLMAVAGTAGKIRPPSAGDRQCSTPAPRPG